MSELEPDEAPSEEACVPPTRSICTLVLGMHRSGTSAVTRVLNLLGADLSDSLISPSEHNTAGHWEPQSIVRFNDRILTEAYNGWDDWSEFDIRRISVQRQYQFKSELAQIIADEYSASSFFTIKDPRISRLLPLYLEVLQLCDIETRIVCMMRNPAAVARSLESRNGYELTSSFLYWLRYNIDLEYGSRDYKRIFVEYDDMLEDWEQLADKFRDDLGLPTRTVGQEEKAKIDEFLTDHLRHFEASSITDLTTPQVVSWVESVHKELVKFQRNPVAAASQKRMDALREEFNSYTDAFSPHVALLRRNMASLSVELNRVEGVNEKQEVEIDRALSEFEIVQGELLDNREVLAQTQDLLFQAQGNLDQSRDAITELADKIVLANDMLDKARNEIAHIQINAEAEITARDDLIVALNDEVTRTRELFVNSTTWRMTAPLRKGVEAIKGIRVPGVSMGLLPALRYHGPIGASRKFIDFAREFGVRSAFRKSKLSLRLHKANDLRTGGAAGRDDPLRPEQASDIGIAPEIDAFAQLQTARDGYLNVLGRRNSPTAVTKPGLLIISDTTLPQCIKYRINNKVDGLIARGGRAKFCHPDDVGEALSQMQYFPAVMFYRMEMSDRFMVFHNEARRLGLAIYYDIDDPVFDAPLLKANENLKLIEPHHLVNLVRDADKIRSAMERCDFMTASTPFLASLMSQASGGKPSFVWRNVADQSALDIGAKITTTESGGRSRAFRLGYFSGSLAHKADFIVAEDAIANFLEEHANVELLLYGHTGASEKLDRFSERISRVGFSDYEAYLKAVASCDVMVVPLMDDAFNRCKSVVRYIDAAVVKTPVIASSVGDYKELITQGENGWLCGPDDWAVVLREVASDPEGCVAVGQNARQFVEESFSVTTNVPLLDAHCKSMIFGN